ncbi:MAG TPA: extracellular solute-binding protein, partial [Candidatus Binatia bacterium]
MRRVGSNRFVFWFLISIGLFLVANRPTRAAQIDRARQAEWEQTVRDAEKEGQVTVSIGGYGAIIDSGAFQKAYPKIKVTHITGAGTDLTQRISAERRAGRYLVDVYNGGGNSLFQVLYVGKMLDPIKPALLLPEVTDPTKWWEGKQKYLDKEGQYILVYEGNVAAGAGAGYNTQLLDPRDYRSYWDFLNPKLKGKIMSTDIRRVRGAGIPWQFLYYHPDLGPNFLRRLFGEMDVTMVADLRQAVDWLGSGKFALCLPVQGGTIFKAKNQGLPVDQFESYHF